MGLTDTNILLETGTNELEILEFIIAGNSYGINVAKITELMQVQEVQPMPLSHPCVEGVFQPRSDVYPLVDLARYLNLDPSANPEKDIYIITTFNQVNIAFHVHAVESIYRLSWQNIEKPNVIVYGGDEGVVTGIAKVNDRIISILDFEKIAFDICPETGINIDTIKEIEGGIRSAFNILVAEDSALLRKMLQEALTKAGYSNLIIKDNGQDAWDYLQMLLEGDAPPVSQVACVVTDIEMPKMDGHSLTRMIKSDAKLRDIPVVIFSSLIDENMYKKGVEVGADGQLSKPEIEKLVDVVDTMINR